MPSTAACFERELSEEARYVIDAKDVITLLGTQGSSSEEYAPRLWQGILAGYYHHRWEMWYDHIEETLLANKTYDEAPYAAALRDWQERWLLSDTRYRTQPRGDAVQLSKALFDKYSHLLRGGTPQLKSDDGKAPPPPSPRVAKLLKQMSLKVSRHDVAGVWVAFFSRHLPAISCC